MRIKVKNKQFEMKKTLQMSIVNFAKFYRRESGKVKLDNIEMFLVILPLPHFRTSVLKVLPQKNLRTLLTEIG